MKVKRVTIKEHKCGCAVCPACATKSRQIPEWWKISDFSGWQQASFIHASLE